jgi:fucose 4-O-acetylase-like acetyltransferase
MTIKTESVKNNFQWMDIAKGIGITLVVIGHFNPESSPHYWVVINEFIYSFYMPLFFIMSEYLYNHGKYSYRDLMENKKSGYYIHLSPLPFYFF